MRYMIARERIPQVVLRVWIGWFLCLLRVIAMAFPIPIQVSGNDLVGDDRFDCGKANIEFASPVMCCPVDRACCDFGFEDRRNRLRLSGQAVFYPIRSEEHTSELQSRFGISYAVFC